MKLYTLEIQINKKWYPVQWPTGRVKWDKDSPVKPTIFNTDDRLEVQPEINALGDGFRWVPYLELTNEDKI